MALPFTRTFENDKNLQVTRRLFLLKQNFIIIISLCLKLEWTKLDVQNLRLFVSLGQNSGVFP